MIPFNKPTVLNNEKQYFEELLENNKFSGDGLFTQKCTKWFENNLNSKCLLTTSCTHALEMIAILLDIKEGDEIIMPSYTFVSTANAFVLRGAKIVFVDIRPDTMNIDENKIEKAITDKTKVIVPVHYAGVSCEMDTIMNLAKKYKLFVVEDAAQGMLSTYKGKTLGTIGDFGTYSFHETKNYHCGEGGLLIVNNDNFYHKAEIIREKGTNRSQFIRGQIDKYTWVDMGSSYLPSEFNAMYLYPQLLTADKINSKRLDIWQKYFDGLKYLEKSNCLELATVPKETRHNAHMFYIKLKDIKEREKLIKFLKNNDIYSAFHYIPLHSSPFGKSKCEFNGEDRYTTKDSERLLRLPIYYDLELNTVDIIIKKIEGYFV